MAGAAAGNGLSVSRSFRRRMIPSGWKPLFDQPFFPTPDDSIRLETTL
jgi:hypothetical protein